MMNLTGGTGQYIDIDTALDNPHKSNTEGAKVYDLVLDYASKKYLMTTTCRKVSTRCSNILYLYVYTAVELTLLTKHISPVTYFT